MDVLRGEDVHHLFQHVLEEVVCSDTARAEVHLLVRFVCAREFGICGEHLCRVSRHLYFWHDSDATLSSVAHEVAQLVLSVVAAVCALFAFVLVLASELAPLLPGLSFAPRSEAGETWVALNLDAPSGSVSEVKVEAVELILRHDVNLLLEERNGLEVARHVEHQRAPLESRSVNDVACLDSVLLLQLVYGLPSEAEAVGRSGADEQRVLSDMKAVSLGRRSAVETCEAHHLTSVVCGVGCELLRVDVLCLGANLVDNLQLCGSAERTLARNERLRLGEQRLRRSGRSGKDAAEEEGC